LRKTIVKQNRYFDSVFLMLVARRIAAQPGIRDASAVLGTAANRKVLAAMGYGAGDEAFAGAGPNDLVLALEGEPAAVDAGAARFHYFDLLPLDSLRPLKYLATASE